MSEFRVRTDLAVEAKESFEEEVTWYENKKNYLDTIVDEHYYRSNDYLLENVDRYNYYYRAKEKIIQKVEKEQ